MIINEMIQYSTCRDGFYSISIPPNFDRFFPPSMSACMRQIILYLLNNSSSSKIRFPVVPAVAFQYCLWIGRSGTTAMTEEHFE